MLSNNKIKMKQFSNRVTWDVYVYFYRISIGQNTWFNLIDRKTRIEEVWGSLKYKVKKVAYYIYKYI